MSPARHDRVQRPWRWTPEPLRNLSTDPLSLGEMCQPVDGRCSTTPSLARDRLLQIAGAGARRAALRADTARATALRAHRRPSGLGVRRHLYALHALVGFGRGHTNVSTRIARSDRQSSLACGLSRRETLESCNGALSDRDQLDRFG
jgi:hypothetical protein